MKALCTNPARDSLRESSMVIERMSRPPPPTYKTRNWPACNEALKRQGSLTIWFDPEMSWGAWRMGRRGRQQTYCNSAIQSA